MQTEHFQFWHILTNLPTISTVLLKLIVTHWCNNYMGVCEKCCSSCQTNEAFAWANQIPSKLQWFLWFVFGLSLLPRKVSFRQELGLIHSHFTIGMISNSTVDHFDIDSISTLLFCTDGCLMTKMHHIRHWISYNVKCIAFSSSNNRYNK